MSRILVVAPSSEAESLTSVLEMEEFAVESLSDSALLVAQVLSGDFALVIINASQPEVSRINGIELLRRIRQSSLLPVMIISDGQSDTQRVLALELGADDYIQTPYLQQELIART